VHILTNIFYLSESSQASSMNYTVQNQRSATPT
jgi:hypothetical protein